MKETPSIERRYDMEILSSLSVRLLVQAGLSEEKSIDVTNILRESDILGHRTHGFAILPTYLQRIVEGKIAKIGKIDTLADTGAAFAWSANRLPGAWVLQRAIDLITDRIAEHSVVTATIANCSHIGCLQAYLPALTRRNLFVTLSATNPGIRSVAPFGGTEPILTSNPIAFGIPTELDPILIDQCTSVVSNTEIQAYASRGEPTPGKWLVDSDGHATDDSALLTATPPATIMPLGGEDFGYKGYGFSLMVEALTLALSGYGRTSAPDQFGQSVFIQVIDPNGFAGQTNFLRETTDLARSCKESRPKVGGRPVRLPGQRALSERPQNLQRGLPFEDSFIEKMKSWAKELNVTFEQGW